MRFLSGNADSCHPGRFPQRRTAKETAKMVQGSPLDRAPLAGGSMIRMIRRDSPVAYSSSPGSETPTVAELAMAADETSTLPATSLIDALTVE